MFFEVGFWLVFLELWDLEVLFVRSVLGVFGGLLCVFFVDLFLFVGGLGGWLCCVSLVFLDFSFGELFVGGFVFLFCVLWFVVFDIESFSLSFSVESVFDWLDFYSSGGGFLLLLEEFEVDVVLVLMGVLG